MSDGGATSSVSQIEQERADWPLDDLLTAITRDARRRARACGGGTATFGDLEGETVVSGWHTDAFAGGLHTARQIQVGHPWLRGGADPTRAPRGERNRSVSHRLRRTEMLSPLALRLVATYREGGACDEARVLLYDGHRAVGIICVHRALDEAPYSEADLRRYDAGIPSWRRQMLRAQAVAEAFEGASAALLFRESGRLVHASAVARRWLDRERRRAVEGLARAVLASETSQRDFLVGGGVVARFSVLRGQGEARVLATLGATGPALVPLGGELSARQWEVVGMAAAGATAREIAVALHLSPHTVRDHIKTAYRVLGVQSRSELARLALEGGLR